MMYQMHLQPNIGFLVLSSCAQPTQIVLGYAGALATKCSLTMTLQGKQLCTEDGLYLEETVWLSVLLAAIISSFCVLWEAQRDKRPRYRPRSASSV